jgi:Holliday junction resolvase
MSRKSKGINAERELIHLFWKNGWAATRVAGSGSIKYPTPDIVAGIQTRKLAVECKATKDTSYYFTKEEVDQLKEFSEKFGAEPWLAIRFNGMKWFFFNPEDLRKTEKSLMISLEYAKTKGLLFEEVIK